MQNKAKNTTFPDLSVQMCIASYQDYLHSLSKKWEKLSYTDLYDWEKCSSSYFMFLNAGKEEQAIFTINRNPYPFTKFRNPGRQKQKNCLKNV